MWLITYEAFPNPKANSEQFAEYGGAFVNCWINFIQEDGALKLAKFYIKDSGWIPKRKCEEISWIGKKTDLENEHDKFCFSEAKKYGCSLCFHTYPIEDEEETELEKTSVNSQNNQKENITDH